MSTNVIAAVDDMFFASKIRAVAEHLGRPIRFLRSNEAVIEAVRTDAPALVIVDLHSQKVDAVELARSLKRNESSGQVSLIGFYSHVETALRQAAEEAGYDRVLPRSAFTNQLADILNGVVSSE